MQGVESSIFLMCFDFTSELKLIKINKRNSNLPFYCSYKCLIIWTFFVCHLFASQSLHKSHCMRSLKFPLVSSLCLSRYSSFSVSVCVCMTECVCVVCVGGGGGAAGPVGLQLGCWAGDLRVCWLRPDHCLLLKSQCI